MGWLTTMLGWFGGTSQGSGEQIASPLSRPVALTRPEVGIDGAMQVSAVWACVELLTETVASLPCFVYENTSGRRELARETDLWRLLHVSPNGRHTPVEFWQFMVMQYLLRGNAYALVERGTNGDAVALWPLNADQVRVTAIKGGSLSYEYVFDGMTAVYSEARIFHWRDKGNGLVGMSRLAYMQSTLGIALGAQDQAAKMHSREGRRPGVFSIDKLLTPEQRKQIRENFRGLKEAGEDDLLILEAGAKWEPISLTPAETQLLESRRFSIEDIARWFGIPSVLINDTAKTTTWGTGVQQIVEGFVKFKLRPMVTALEQSIMRRVLTPAQRATMTVEFSMDALLRSSLKDRASIYAQLVQNGIQTRNECRQLENLPPMDGGDLLTAQTNLAPVGDLPGIGGGDVPENPVAQ